MTVHAHSSARKSTQAFLSQLQEESKVIQAAHDIALEAVHGIGFFSATIEDEPHEWDAKTTIATWCCIVGLKSNLWIDIMVEAEMDATLAAFQGITASSNASTSDAYDLLGEIANFVRGGFKKKMSELGEDSLTPRTPKDVPGGNIHTINHYPCAKHRTYIKSGDFRLVTTLLIHEVPPEAKTLGMLREFDISLESIPITKGSTLEILAKGVVLNRSWIEKLRNRFMKEAKLRHITVVSPPSMTMLFHPKF